MKPMMRYSVISLISLTSLAGLSWADAELGDPPQWRPVAASKPSDVVAQSPDPVARSLPDAAEPPIAESPGADKPAAQISAPTEAVRVLPEACGACTTGCCNGDGCSSCSCCQSPCCDGCCNSCGCRNNPPGTVWVDAEFLLWWVRGMPIPPLVTTGPTTSAGVLGQPGTQVLLGGSIDEGGFYGGRFSAGGWLDDGHMLGLEGSYFFLSERSRSYSYSAPDAVNSPVLARPFFDVNPSSPRFNQQDSELAAFPGLISGGILVRESTFFEGADINGIGNLYCGSNGRIDALAGFRYLHLNESLFIGESSVVAAAQPSIGGDAITSFDNFVTQNRFYGGQIGLQGEAHYNRLFANFSTKFAMGATEESADLLGMTTIRTPAGAVSTTSGGLLTQPTNIGHYSRSAFAIVPEVGFNLGVQVTQHIRAYVGYNFIYMSEVIRPGELIDTTVNASQVPHALGGSGALAGASRPAFSFNGTDFWAQGIDFGVELRY